MNEIYRTRKRNKLIALCIVLAMVGTALICNGMLVYAESTNKAVSSERAENDLTKEVAKEIAGNSYEADGGGHYQGSELMPAVKGEQGRFDLDEDKFNELSSKGQQEVVSDICTAADKANKDSEEITDKTVENWYKQLQSKDGVGSKFMSEILKHTKPDFVTANKIYEPFSGPISTLIGIVAVVTAALLGLVMAADISYIVLPPVRMLVADNEGDGKPLKSKIFSYDAIYAVRAVEEESDSARGGGKQSLGIYFKRRIWALILFGICLLYLVQGQLYTLVSMVLTLVNGFIGF